MKPVSHFSTSEENEVSGVNGAVLSLKGDMQRAGVPINIASIPKLHEEHKERHNDITEP